MTATCNFTSVSFINSTCHKLVGKQMVTGHCDGRKCASVAKCLNGNHVTAGHCKAPKYKDGSQSCYFFYTAVTTNGHEMRHLVNQIYLYLLTIPLLQKETIRKPFHSQSSVTYCIEEIIFPPLSLSSDE